jgi:hypothetical protein
MPTTITMQTVTRRERIASETRAAFGRVAAPVHCVSVQTEPPSNRMNGVNAHRALRQAVQQKRQAVLLIEDDLIPSSTLPDWLDYLEHTTDHPVALYLASEHFFPATMLDVARGAYKSDPKPHLGPVNRVHMWWGSQAVWIPQAIAEEYLAHPRIAGDVDNIRTFDVEFRVFLQRDGLPFSVTFPNLVQHANERNVISPQRPIHKTRCYRDDVRPPAIPPQSKPPTQG